MIFNELKKRYGVTKHTDLGEQLEEVPQAYGMFYVSQIEMNYGRKHNKSMRFEVKIDKALLAIITTNPNSAAQARELVEKEAISAVRQVLDQL